jgi:hypothetical protein
MNGGRPGLSAVSYRLGTYETFRRRILDRIAGATVAGSVPATGLRALLTRRDDDYAITLIDLWAAVAEILSFYQERYANESFLRTARAVESIVGLASLAQPELSATAATAGAAAIAQLLFTVAPGADVTIPAGLRLQSQGAAPQVFETFDAVVARPILNRLRLHPPQVPQNGFTGDSVVLDFMTGPALSAQLKPGAKVVLYSSATVEEKEVASVTMAEDRVTVGWKTKVALTDQASAYQRRRTFRLFGWNAPDTYVADGVVNQLTDHSYPSTTFSHTGDVEKPDGVLGTEEARFCLDGLYPGLAAGQRLLVADPSAVTDKVVMYLIDQVDEVVDTFGALTAAVTRVRATRGDGGKPPTFTDRRQVLVYELIGASIKPADMVDSDSWDTDPTRSRTVILTGRQPPGKADADHIEVGLTIAGGAFRPGVVLSVKDLPVDRRLLLADATSGPPQPVRVTTAPTIDGADGFRRMTLTLDVSPTVDPRTAVAMGNLGVASHGQTVSGEVLGSSTGAPFQTFTLKRQPLAFVPSPAGGAASSLHVFVDGVEWKDVPTLAGRGPSEPVFTTRPGDAGRVIVAFGDGVAGRLPPAGRGNVTASYRVGGGKAGNVSAASITSLFDRPPGLLTVTNPFPAAGGQDPGSAATIKSGIGAAVRTVGRAVSERDFEDVLLQAAGVTSARVTIEPAGATTRVTIAAATGDHQPLDQAARDRIAGALAGRFDPTYALDVGDAFPGTKVPVAVHARLTLGPDALASQVRADAQRALADLFAAGAAAPAQNAIAVALQRVAGVVGVVVIGYDPQVDGGIAVAGELTLDLVGGLAGER